MYALKKLYVFIEANCYTSAMKCIYTFLSAGLNFHVAF